MAQEPRFQAINISDGREVPVAAGSRVLEFPVQRCPWLYADVEQIEVGVYQNPDMFNPNLIVSMAQTIEPFDVEFKRNGRTNRQTFGGETFSLLARGELGQWTCYGAHKTLLVSIKNSLVNQLAAESGLPERTELPFLSPLDDDLVAAVMRAMNEEARTGFAGGRILGDSLTAALVAHLLSRYGSTATTISEPKGGLSTAVLREVKDFMHERYADDITLAQLARVAHLSPYHFCRLFKHSTGETPHQYVTRCRVVAAHKLISSSGMSIKQVATAVGFCDASHLAKHFKALYGQTPSEFAGRIAEN